MKKKYYDVGTYIYLRNNKCTTGLIIASAVAAVGALGSSAINAASQSSANAANMQLNKDTLEEQKQLFHEANEFNHDEASLARNFNANEADKARSFNSAEAQKNRTFQAGMLERAMQQYEDWNSASSQVQRHLDAGLNPATLAGNLQSGQGFGIPSGATASSSPASSSPASSAGIPNLPTAHVQPVDYGSVFENALKSGFDTASNIQSVKKQVTENKFFSLQQQAGLDLTRAQSDEIYHKISLIDSEVNLTNKKIEETGAIIKNLTSQTENLDVDKQIKEIEKLYKNDFYKYQVKELQEKYKYSKGLAETIVALTYSQIASNYGSAASSYSQAKLNKCLESLNEAEKLEVEAATSLLQTQDSQSRYDLFLKRQFGWKQEFWKTKNIEKTFDKLDYETGNTYRIIQGVKDCAVGAGAAVGTAYGVTKGISGTKNYIYGNSRFSQPSLSF